MAALAIGSGIRLAGSLAGVLKKGDWYVLNGMVPSGGLIRRGGGDGRESLLEVTRGPLRVEGTDR